MYAELHGKTNFSFLEGASHPDELVCRAAELGYRALAVTDRNSLAGVVRAHGAAKEEGLKLIIGAEITPDDAPPVVLWATRSRRLWPAGAADYPGPPPRRKRRVPPVRRRHRPACRGAAGGNQGEGSGRGKLRMVGKSSSHDTAGRHVAICQFAISPLSALLSYRDLFRPTAAICWPNCTAGRTIGGSSIVCSSSRGRRASRWWRPATCIITCPSGPPLHDVLTAVRLRLHGGRGHAAPVSQRRTASEIAGRNGRPVRRRAPPRCAARWRLPTAARFRSTSCAMNIPRSWPRRA